LRIDPGLRSWNYATLAALFATGAIWLVADQLKASENEELWQAIAANMLMIHGITAMVALMLLGAMIPMHIQRSWRAGKNRISGAAMVAANAALVTTACGLYYAGSDLLRTFVADAHIAVGLGLPALVVTHIILGRRARTVARPERSRSLQISAAFHTVTFSEDRGSR
jgi:predicted transporter